jgi:flagellar biosynthesis/type III secretory pathway M-ring protein FliF/YscJ
MRDFLQGLLEQMKTTGPATKAVLGMGLLLLAGLIGYASYSAGTPHFRLLYSGLDPQQASAVQAALAGGNLRYEVSQPPGPYSVHVEDGQYYQAQNLVALAGGLALSPEGIQANQSGAKDVFLSAGERSQNALKREWQEMEKQLEQLDFVAGARVSTSIPEASVLRKSQPMTVAVTLQVASGMQITHAQAATVAKLVRFRFGVPSENVMISDQSGRGLWDGTQQDELTAAANEVFDHKSRYDGELASRTNLALERAVGPGLAYIVLDSTWKHERRESIKKTLDPANKVVTSKNELKTSTPQDPIGVVNGDEPGANAAPQASVPTATTSESRQTTAVGEETSHSLDEAPTLERQTVSLFLDESLKDKQAQIEEVVKNAVGLVESRDGKIATVVAPLFSVPRDDKGAIVKPAAPEKLEAPSRTLDTLLQHGVEIAAALVFLVVLLKALKRAPRALTVEEPGSPAHDPFAALAAAEEIVDPRMREMVARRQIDELIRNDPERVSTILSRWAADEERTARAR